MNRHSNNMFLLHSPKGYFKFQTGSFSDVLSVFWLISYSMGISRWYGDARKRNRLANLHICIYVENLQTLQILRTWIATSILLNYHTKIFLIFHALGTTSLLLDRLKTQDQLQLLFKNHLPIRLEKIKGWNIASLPSYFKYHLKNANCQNNNYMFNFQWEAGR